MRRPGSRSFECVRRAWHSERHQPIRGSLIQEIFRVVNEVHSSTTKKNKEWQEKLPIVVLKAEEILYSKADSEGEYMDISTLRDRVSEAINTIIRLDESTETGEFLHPCIEAALYLGCTPNRSSRSNQSSNLRCYLNSCTQDSITTPPYTPDKAIRLAESSRYFSFFPNFSKQTSNSVYSRSKCPNHSASPNRVDSNHKYPFVSENVLPSISNQQFLRNTVSGWNMFSLCPLYSGNNNPMSERQKPGIQILPKSLSSNNFLSIDTKNINESNIANAYQEQCEAPCDLSLQLGPLSVPHPSIDTGRSKTINNIGASTSENQFTSSIDNYSQLDRKVSFLPRGNAYGSLETCSWEQRFRVDI